MFDCDGVLVDSEPHSVGAWIDVLGRYGHPATEDDIDRCVGLGFGPTHAVLSVIEPLPPSGEVWPVLLEALERSFGEGLVVFDDALSVLDAVMVAGIPVAVASASPRERLDLTLQSVGLAGRFAVSVAGDEVDAGKPDPAVYLAALEALGCGASGAVAIEDTVAGARSALGAGMAVVAVARVESSADLEATGALVVDRLDPQLFGV